MCDLSWGARVEAAVNMPNKVLGIVFRTLGPKNQEAFYILYITLVRPILEYADPVWCPYLVKDILALKKRCRRYPFIHLGEERQSGVKSLV